MAASYEISENYDNNETTSTLHISAASRTDNGLYACMASNLYGKDEKRIDFIVQGKPINCW